jgi:hypothetical protein
MLRYIGFGVCVEFCLPHLISEDSMAMPFVNKYVGNSSCTDFITLP